MHPIVIYDEGGNDNLFGYSLAFLKGQFGASVPVYGTLFIGAPKETRFTRNSGVVWSCQFRMDDNRRCSIISRISNGTTRGGRTQCQKEVALSYPESEAEQFIGFSLAATPSELMACAPRWKRNGYLNSSNACVNETLLLGACYKLSVESNGNSSMSRQVTSRSGPYDDPDSSGIVRNKNLWYRFAQYGFSSHATRSHNFVVGAPSYTAATGMFVEYPEENRTTMHNDTQPYTHLGYSITSGRCGGIGGIEYLAVGAPRGGSLFGSVVIKPEIIQTSGSKLFGEQFGSYFGYSLATSDLNGDGNDELIVGAPFHNANFNEGYCTGCVYIFGIDLGSDSQAIRTTLHLNLCLDNEAKGARFGSAIASLGDINFDGNEDFVVAAPYHDGGVGTVFVYHGNLPLSSTPAQVIQGKSLNIPNLFGFGTSLLSGNLDIDGNLSPDLAISSFESNHVVILRSRPIAKPSLMLSFHTANSTNEHAKIYRFLPYQKENRIRLRERQNRQSRIQLRVGLSYNAPDVRTRAKKTVTVATLNIAQRGRSDARFNEAFKLFNPNLPTPIPLTFSSWEGLEIATDNCDSDRNPECDPNLGLYIEMNFEDSKGLILPQNDSFVVGQVEAIILRIKLANTHETAYGVTLRVALAFSDDFYLTKTEWRWQVREEGGRIESFRGNPKESNGILNVEDIVRRSGPLQNDSNIFYTLRISNLQQIKVSDCLQGKIHVVIQAFPEGQREKEKVEKDLEILLKAGVDIDIQAVMPTTGESEIDPKTKAVDLTQIYILNNTGYSTVAAGKIKMEILIPTQTLIHDKLTEVIGIANPSQYSFGLRCKAIGFSFYESSVFSQYETSATKEFELEPEDLRTRVDDSPQTFHFPSFNDDWISFPICNDAQTSQHCRKIICFTDSPSMGTKTVQIRMHLLPVSAATSLVSKDSAGIRIKTSISVYYLKTGLKKEGESWRKFIVMKRISFWMIALAVGFFRRQAKEHLKGLRCQLPLLKMDEDVIETSTENGGL
ncbi:unnamed protein product [Orchesella dallaii]|uniref:Integrin alpha-2 domain-containing protein n=1 Tax=Orchesella dallaii TaxID=48710 RepID=A0ABP1QYA1_9HEXA